MISTALIITIIVMGIANVLAAIFLAIEVWKRNECERSESNFCPSYACTQQDSQCGIKPYRMENGKKVCQIYLTEPALKTYKT